MQRKLVKNLMLVLTLVVLCLAVGMSASAETWGDYEYILLEDGTIEITDYNGISSEIEIPAEIDGKVVTSIGYRAFAGCNNIEEIKIANTIEHIGDGVFLDCFKLKNINIPANVTSIGYACFEWCSNLKAFNVDENNIYYSNDEYGVLFNKDKTILIQYPIGNENSIYKIPDSVTNITDGAFYYALNLTEAILPNNLKIIGSYAFQACFNLDKINIPYSVEYIGDYAFYWLFFLDEIVIGNLNVDLGEYAVGASDCIVTDISREDFSALAHQYFTTRDESIYVEMAKYMRGSDSIAFIGTMYCHAGSTAEAYAVENSMKYETIHFYEGEWTYDYNNNVKYRKCILCGEIEKEILESETSDEPKKDLFASILDWLKALFELILSWFKK